jgi:hypothetical protein
LTVQSLEVVVTGLLAGLRYRGLDVTRPILVVIDAMKIAVIVSS